MDANTVLKRKLEMLAQENAALRAKLAECDHIRRKLSAIKTWLDEQERLTAD